MVCDLGSIPAKPSFIAAETAGVRMLEIRRSRNLAVVGVWRKEMIFQDPVSYSQIYFEILVPFLAAVNIGLPSRSNSPRHRQHNQTLKELQFQHCNLCGAGGRTFPEHSKRT